MTNTTEEDSKARSRTFFKGIVPKELLSTPEEWHAFVIGFFEILCPWPARYKMSADYYKDVIDNEHHYYLAGRAAAVMVWIAIAKLIQVIFW
jgi:hypothetical protein